MLSVALILLITLAGSEATPAADVSSNAKAPLTKRSIGLNQVNQEFLAIGHMANHPDAVDFYVENGMNAVEADLWIREDGSLHAFEHWGSCDCSACYCSNGANCPSDNVCRVLWDATGEHCYASSPPANLTAHVLGKPEIAVFYIDCKFFYIEDMSNSEIEAAGASLVALIENNAGGFTGQVIISVAEDYSEELTFLEAVVAAAEDTADPSRYFVTIDGLRDHFEYAADAMVSVSENRVYSTGITACAPFSYYDSIRNGVYNTDNGAMAGTIIWTLDKSSSMEQYVAAGVTGIMTNFPSRLKAVVEDKDLELATQSQHSLTTATEDEVVILPPLECDCDYSSNGGCHIVQAAPDGYACLCDNTDYWTCYGYVVFCSEPGDELCENPDMSLASCEYGGGDCGGY